MNKTMLAALALAAAVAGIFSFSSGENFPATGVEVAHVPQRASNVPTDTSLQSSEYVQTERPVEMRRDERAHIRGADMSERAGTQYGKASPSVSSSTHPSMPGRGSTGDHSDFEKFVRSLTPEQWAAMDAAADRLKMLADNQASIEEIAAAMADYKTAAGPQGIPGIDLDGVINSLQSTASMMRKSEELQKLVDQYERRRNSASKEDLAQIAEKIRSLQKEMATPAKVPG